MKKLIIGLAVVVACSIATKAFAGKAITGSKHDFITTAYTDSNNKTLFAYNKCTTCHGAHKVARKSQLWNRSDPGATGWLVWNGTDAGQALDGTNNTVTAANFVASASGMCMSCHDGVTALGKTADGLSDVFMKTGVRPNWGKNLADSHPVGKTFTFDGVLFQSSLSAGNTAAGSNVAVENGAVGCTSCHSMHSSGDNDKILRTGEVCVACHKK